MGWFEERIPETKDAFGELRNSIFKDGALDVKTKELIAVAASGLMRCEFCVKVHTERAKQHGATKIEIAEALSVAMFVAGGSQLHWSEVLNDVLK
ncbi:MAG: carboxymuconolactone decarboxylase family protein [ANME-2 cluster archaeon]|nr:carboxymuconolactone decarboxylase family protein [ANME-2 cluster archaeon]